MKLLKRTFAVLVLAGFAGACNAGAPPPPESEADYAAQIERFRVEKDEAFRSQPNEPVPPGKVKEFLPLKYFPPDHEYVVPASLKPAGERVEVDIPTSAGKIRKQQRVGVLEFTLKGQALTLGAFVESGADMRSLFVPFSDMTSGTETYSAGRYLELERTPTGLYTIDFNKAFNPWCYYNEEFDCPYPPRESRLPLPIRAGERLP